MGRTLRYRLAAAIVGSLLAVASPMAAGAATPATLVLYADHTWTASGAIDDAGTWARVGTINGSFPSPVEGAFNLHIDLTGGHGTLATRFLLEFNQSQEQLLCDIDGGTGAYTQTRGQGTYTETHPASGPLITGTIAVSAP